MGATLGRVRTKLIALIAFGALLATASVARGGPVTVAFYSFQGQGDVQAFQRVTGASCKRKWRQGKAMAVVVGRGTNSCAFRSSVVADSSDTSPDQDLSATAALGAKAPRKLRKKGYAGLAVRSSDTAGYELRVLPFARKWQLLRDPKGPAGPTVIAVGRGKPVRPRTKPNAMQLRAFDYGAPTVRLFGVVNRKTVVALTDSGADKPDGRRTAVITGRKGVGPGTGLTGIFDNVAVRVPNPF